MRQDIGRSEHGAHDERAHDHVAADRAQLFQTDHAEADQHDHYHRHLEGDPEGDEHGENERQVFVDVRHHLHAGGRVIGKETECNREYGKVRECHPEREKNHARHDDRHRQAFLVVV